MNVNIERSTLENCCRFKRDPHRLNYDPGKVKYNLSDKLRRGEIIFNAFRSTNTLANKLIASVFQRKSSLIITECYKVPGLLSVLFFSRRLFPTRMTSALLVIMLMTYFPDGDVKIESPSHQRERHLGEWKTHNQNILLITVNYWNWSAAWPKFLELSISFVRWWANISTMIASVLCKCTR